MTIKDGDFCSYATVDIQSHGFMVRTNETFKYRAEVTQLFGIELQNNTDPMFRVSIKLDEVNKLVWDIRSNGPSSFVMVYKAGLSKKEVLKMIQPQLHARLVAIKEAYDMLGKNAAEMVKVTEHNINQTDFICGRK